MWAREVSQTDSSGLLAGPPGPSQQLLAGDVFIFQALGRVRLGRGGAEWGGGGIVRGEKTWGNKGLENCCISGTHSIQGLSWRMKSTVQIEKLRPREAQRFAKSHGLNGEAGVTPEALCLPTWLLAYFGLWVVRWGGQDFW